MDDVLNRMARELSDAIAAAVAEDPRVEACRERVRAAGYEMRVSLEAVIGFVNRTQPGALAKVSAPPKVSRTERRNLEMSANDRRFLRSLRIAAEEAQEKKKEVESRLRAGAFKGPGANALGPFFVWLPLDKRSAARNPKRHR